MSEPRHFRKKCDALKVPKFFYTPASKILSWNIDIYHMSQPESSIGSWVPDDSNINIKFLNYTGNV